MVAVCVVAALLLLVNDYTGYSIITAAVGLAAAVNLLPSPYSSGVEGSSSEPRAVDSPPPAPPDEEPRPEGAPPSEPPRKVAPGEGPPEEGRTDVSGST